MLANFCFESCDFTLIKTKIYQQVRNLLFYLRTLFFLSHACKGLRSNFIPNWIMIVWTVTFLRRWNYLNNATRLNVLGNNEIFIMIWIIPNRNNLTVHIRGASLSEFIINLSASHWVCPTCSNIKFIKSSTFKVPTTAKWVNCSCFYRSEFEPLRFLLAIVILSKLIYKSKLPTSNANDQ